MHRDTLHCDLPRSCERTACFPGNRWGWSRSEDGAQYFGYRVWNSRVAPLSPLTVLWLPFTWGSTGVGPHALTVSIASSKTAEIRERDFLDTIESPVKACSKARLGWLFER